MLRLDLILLFGLAFLLPNSLLAQDRYADHREGTDHLRFYDVADRIIVEFEKKVELPAKTESLGIYDQTLNKKSDPLSLPGKAYCIFSIEKSKKSKTLWPGTQFKAKGKTGWAYTIAIIDDAPLSQLDCYAHHRKWKTDGGKMFDFPSLGQIRALFGTGEDRLASIWVKTKEFFKVERYENLEECRSDVSSYLELTKKLPERRQLLTAIVRDGDEIIAKIDRLLGEIYNLDLRDELIQLMELVTYRVVGAQFKIRRLDVEEL